jgi:hypothetical protein
MGKIQHLGNSVNHGVTQGDYGIYAPQAQSINEIGQKTHPAPPKNKSNLYFQL